MNRQSRIIEAAILSVGLILMGQLIKSGMDNFTGKDQKVTVKGLSEMEVDADMITWPIVSKEIGDNLPSLYERINSTTSDIKAFLKENGIQEEDISVGAPVVIDLSAERYGSNDHNYRYNITSVITVKSSQVSLVRGIIDRQGELLKKGIAIVDGGYENPIKYDYISFQDLKPQMMEEAIANAQSTAAQFAQNSSSKLGKIVSASQGQFSIEDRDSNTPNIKKIRVVTTITYQLK